MEYYKNYLYPQVIIRVPANWDRGSQRDRLRGRDV